MHERGSDLHQQPDLRLTDREYQMFSDDELARWRAFWQQRIALAGEEEPDAALRASTETYCAVPLGAVAREEGARRRAAPLGVGRQHHRDDDRQWPTYRGSRPFSLRWRGDD